MASSDWMPTSRQARLDRIEVWLRVLYEETTGSDGKPAAKKDIWRANGEDIEKLSSLFKRAKELLALAKDKATRTAVLNQQVEDVFNELETFMRQFKTMYFHAPPLSNADMVSLGFAVKDSKPSPLGNPTAAVAVRTKLRGNYGELDVFIEAAAGDLKARENQGGVYLVWGAFPPGSPAPINPKELTDDHIHTKRQKEPIRCGMDKSGWDIYFCARIEQGDRKGEWGPMVHAKVP